MPISETRICGSDGVSRIRYVSDTDTPRIRRRYVSWTYPRAGPYWAGKPQIRYVFGRIRPSYSPPKGAGEELGARSAAAREEQGRGAGAGSATLRPPHPRPAGHARRLSRWRMGGVGHGGRGGGVGRRRAWPPLVGGGRESGLRAWPPPASDPLEPGRFRRAWPPPAPDPLELNRLRRVGQRRRGRRARRGRSAS